MVMVMSTARGPSSLQSARKQSASSNTFKHIGMATRAVAALHALRVGWRRWLQLQGALHERCRAPLRKLQKAPVHASLGTHDHHECVGGLSKGARIKVWGAAVSSSDHRRVGCPCGILAGPGHTDVTACAWPTLCVQMGQVHLHNPQPHPYLQRGVTRWKRWALASGPVHMAPMAVA